MVLLIRQGQDLQLSATAYFAPMNQGKNMANLVLFLLNGKLIIYLNKFNSLMFEKQFNLCLDGS